MTVAPTRPGLVDQFGQPLHRVGAHVGYVAGSRSHQDLAAWLPRRLSAQGAISPDRNLVAARAHDLDRNDGWASAGLARQVDNIIGGGWRLNARLSRRRLGLDDAAATDIAATIEAEFADWANDSEAWCDAGRRLTFGGLMALAYRHRAMDGEALGVIQHIVARDRPWSTAVQMIDPDRLEQPQGRPATPFFRDGLELGPMTEPLAYHIRTRHAGDGVMSLDAVGWLRVPRHMNGLRVVVHAFEPGRSGQVRGVSPLAPIIKKLRMLGRYDEAELQAAVVNAVLAAFVTSPYDPKELAESLAAGDPDPTAAYNDGRHDWWKDHGPLRLDGAQVNVLYQGEDVKFSDAAHPNAVFEHFVKASLRNVASAMGITYEQLSADWSEVNYSSARAALLEVWRGFTARAAHFAAGFVQPIYVRWFEEAVARRRIVLPRGAPSFEAARSAWTSARWLMPGRGWVDPLKEAQAARERLAVGLTTLEREAAEQGIDWEEMVEQRARELARLSELERRHGLAPGSLAGTALAPSGAGKPGKIDDEEDDDA